MTQQTITFENTELGQIRTFIPQSDSGIEEPILFYLYDICKILDIPVHKAKKIISSKDKDARFITHIIMTGKGFIETPLIDEWQVGYLIVDSSKPNAKALQKLIVKQIIPITSRITAGVFSIQDFKLLEVGNTMSISTEEDMDEELLTSSHIDALKRVVALKERIKQLEQQVGTLIDKVYNLDI